MHKFPKWLIDTFKISILLDILLLIYNLAITHAQWILFIPQCLLSFLFLLIYNYLKMIINRKKENDQKLTKKKEDKKVQANKVNQENKLRQQEKRKNNNQNKQKR
ncbi:hypothetical protein GSH19_00715 [Lactobacillus sp. S2-2]|uniref:hypothetical protein n=1 Tax=Lactobacillus sp. S2-2 TaxID=2692917 RepID=UPI001F2DD935|nr:hypothetical protein [Lactobacillus sp. S2-2]MCF6514709.1 hypothetical protein [Lactobacillus sp. S2-2]